MNEGGQEYRKALANRVMGKRKGVARIKRKRPIGSVVQSPDQQYATGTMGKQPVSVFPLQGKWQKENL